MKHVVLEAEEDAKTVRLAAGVRATVPGGHLGFVAVVVLERGNRLIVADVKVVVEVAASFTMGRRRRA